MVSQYSIHVVYNVQVHMHGTTYMLSNFRLHSRSPKTWYLYTFYCPRFLEGLTHDRYYGLPLLKSSHIFCTFL